MAKIPIDAPVERVIAALNILGFVVVRPGNHIALARENSGGTRTTMTLPGQRFIKSSTLRTALTLARIPRDEFVSAYQRT